jgi:hypothetical protein
MVVGYSTRADDKLSSGLNRDKELAPKNKANNQPKMSAIGR